MDIMRHGSDISVMVMKMMTVDGKEPDPDAVRREMSIYFAAPFEKREAVEKRIWAIASLPPLSKRTKADVIAAGELMGVEQSNVYRLLKRVGEYGPVTGLLPGYRAKKKDGAATVGFGEPVDGWIAEAMRARPDIPIAEMSKLLATKAKLLQARNSGVAIALPSQGPLRRRLQALRSEGATGVDGTRPLGESILIDYCMVDLGVSVVDRRSGRLDLHYASAIFIVDMPSSIILGMGIFVADDYAGGLAAAVQDMRRHRLRGLAAEGLEFASRPSTVRWAVPDEMLSAAGDIEQSLHDTPPPIRLELLVGDDGRPGQQIYRHLGGRIGPFELLVRSTTANASDHRRNSIEHVIYGMQRAYEVLAFEAKDRNRRKIESMPPPVRGAVGRNLPDARRLALSIARLLRPAVDRADPDHWSRGYQPEPFAPRRTRRRIRPDDATLLDRDSHASAAVRR